MSQSFFFPFSFYLFHPPLWQSSKVPPPLPKTKTKQKTWELCVCISLPKLSQAAVLCLGQWFLLKKKKKEIFAKPTFPYGLHPCLSLVSWPCNDNQWHFLIISIFIHHLTRQKQDATCHSNFHPNWPITRCHLQTDIFIMCLFFSLSVCGNGACHLIKNLSVCQSQPSRLKTLAQAFYLWD